MYIIISLILVKYNERTPIRDHVQYNKSPPNEVLNSARVSMPVHMDPQYKIVGPNANYIKFGYQNAIPRKM